MMFFQRAGVGYGMMGGYLIGWLVMLFFLLLVIGGIVVLVVGGARASGYHATGPQMPPPGPPGHDDAVAIAKRRYANGEITKEQYDEIIRTLGG